MKSCNRYEKYRATSMQSKMSPLELVFKYSTPYGIDYFYFEHHLLLATMNSGAKMSQG